MFVISARIMMRAPLSRTLVISTHGGSAVCRNKFAALRYVWFPSLVVGLSRRGKRFSSGSGTERLRG